MNSNYAYANQLAAQQQAGISIPTVSSIRSDIEQRVARLKEQCEKFELLVAENEVRKAELRKLGNALAALQAETEQVQS